MLSSIRFFLRASALGARQAPLMSTKASEAPKFDPEMVKAYNKMSANHRHANGPWLKMRDAVLAYHAEAAGGSKKSLVILDLASGPGEPAATIAAALPGCTVVATDVSEDMVAAAAKATAALPNLSAVVADAQNLSGFEDQSVDVITCCYGCELQTPVNLEMLHLTA
jgi:ubiquinone/menaquinone biosynthesis C-methylase UbiE